MKLDITRWLKNGCRWQRRRRMGCGERKRRQWHGQGAGSGPHLATLTWVRCQSGADVDTLWVRRSRVQAVDSTTGPDPPWPHLSARNGNAVGQTHVSDFVRVSYKRLGKSEEKFRAWAKVSTTKETRARK